MTLTYACIYVNILSLSKARYHHLYINLFLRLTPPRRYAWNGIQSRKTTVGSGQPGHNCIANLIISLKTPLYIPNLLMFDRQFRYGIDRNGGFPRTGSSAVVRMGSKAGGRYLKSNEGNFSVWEARYTGSVWLAACGNQPLRMPPLNILLTRWCGVGASWGVQYCSGSAYW
jgi:hypothetical protein